MTLGVPVVLFNRTTHRRICSSVTSDNLAGGSLIANFLLAGSHTRFAFVAGTANSSTNRDRERGYVEALRRAGVGDVMRVVGNYSFDGAREAARALFSRRQKPDAIFVANDHMSFAVMDVARQEFGLRIPEDVSIVGYNDSRVSSWGSYALTTVEQPVAPLVNATVQILMSKIEHGAARTRRVMVEGDLIVRRSARLPRTGIHERNGRTVWDPALQDAPSAPGKEESDRMTHRRRKAP
jgi:LacI family transcriptional regulator